MRQTPDLARVNRAVGVQHILRRHPHRLRKDRSLVRAVARMAAADMIRHASPDPVELDPAADAVAGGQRFRLLERQHLGLQEVQLQRDQQSVLRAPRAHPDEAFARHEHLARDHGLQAVDVGQPVRIGLVGPGEPESLDTVPLVRLPDQCEGLIPSPTGLAAKASQALAA